MKKLMFFFLLILLASCVRNLPVYEVNVVGVAKERIGISTLNSAPSYSAVTASGDTIICIVEEGVRLKNKLPYKAMMRKAESSKYGYVFKTLQKFSSLILINRFLSYLIII